MNTQYTPAPWELRQSTSGYWFIDYDQGGEGYTLTKLECGERDARLIAAAPDLLIALRDLLEDAIALGICESNMSGSAVAARAAIARATGGAA